MKIQAGLIRKIWLLILLIFQLQPENMESVSNFQGTLPIFSFQAFRPFCPQTPAQIDNRGASIQTVVSARLNY